MTQPQQQPSPLTARLYKLEYPRSLGTYSTYAEVQAVVDALADAEFPVENTMIVGTDLKLMERVTGRRTWGKVLLNGALSGVWMGLFIGLLLALFSGQFLTTILSGMVFGIVFFTIWSAISYAATGGNRDFTSMTATIPMQYELMVEHSHAESARHILLDAGATPPSVPVQQATGGHRAPGSPVTPTAPSAPTHGGYGAPAQPSPAVSAGTESRPQYGRPATGAATPASPGSAGGGSGRPEYGRPAPQQEEPTGQYGASAQQAASPSSAARSSEGSERREDDGHDQDQPRP
jgi:hypothetical protein